MTTPTLVFLGGRVFSSAIVCGGSSSITMSGNRNGITLFQNGTVFLDDINLDIHDNVNGIGVFDGSRLTVRRSNILLDDNGFLGLNIGQGSTVRLNDNAPSLAVGSTSIQNNGTFGVLITQNSQATLGNATVLGNPVLDFWYRISASATALERA